MFDDDEPGQRQDDGDGENSSETTHPGTRADRTGHHSPGSSPTDHLRVSTVRYGTKDPGALPDSPEKLSPGRRMGAFGGSRGAGADREVGGVAQGGRRNMTAIRLPTGTYYDPDDIFGVRRALGALTEPEREAFFEEWASLTEECRFDVPSIHGVVRAMVEAADGRIAALDGAWATVDRAITGYLDWRAAR
jgi:hypothetical protein